MELKKNAKLTVSDFWYDLFDGGYIKPEKLLKNKEDINSVREAIEVLEEFRESVEEIIEEI